MTTQERLQRIARNAPPDMSIVKYLLRKNNVKMHIHFPAFTNCEAGMLYCSSTNVETPSRTIPAQYGIIELTSLVASHKPGTWSPNPLYPLKCQQRDYTNDAAEQAKVGRIARLLKPQFLITPAVTSTDGSPIINKDGIVLGGNGRTMALQLLLTMQGGETKLAEYRAYLERTLPVFGLSPNDIEGYKYPVLVRVIESKLSECAMMSNLLNKSLTQGIDITANTVALARQLTEEDLEYIGAMFERSGYDSFSDFMRSPRMVKELVQLLRKREVINDSNISEWIDPINKIVPSELGRLMIQRILLASILPDRSLIEAAANYTNKIVRVLPELLMMRKLDQRYNIIPMLQEVVLTEHRRRAADLPKERFIEQNGLDFSGETDFVALHPDVVLLYDIIDEPINKWKDFLRNYLRIASKQLDGGDEDMFGKKVILTPSQLLREALKH